MIYSGFFPEHSPQPSECSEVAEYLSLGTGSKAFYTAKQLFGIHLVLLYPNLKYVWRYV